MVDVTQFMTLQIKPCMEASPLRSDTKTAGYTMIYSMAAIHRVLHSKTIISAIYKCVKHEYIFSI